MRPVLAFRSRVQLETLPLILAIIVALAGSALVVDAFLGDRSNAPATERRRRIRAERHRVGEALVGLGVLAAAAGIAGRDSWAYSTVAMMVGVVLLVLGAGLNYRLLGESLFHHGVSRRQSVAEPGGSVSVTATSAGARPQGQATTETRSTRGKSEDDHSLEANEGEESPRVDDEAGNKGEDERGAPGIEADRSPPLRIR